VYTLPAAQPIAPRNVGVIEPINHSKSLLAVLSWPQLFQIKHGSSVMLTRPERSRLTHSKAKATNLTLRPRPRPRTNITEVHDSKTGSSRAYQKLFNRIKALMR